MGGREKGRKKRGEGGEGPNRNFPAFFSQLFFALTGLIGKWKKKRKTGGRRRKRKEKKGKPCMETSICPLSKRRAPPSTPWVGGGGWGVGGGGKGEKERGPTTQRGELRLI